MSEYFKKYLKDIKFEKYLNSLKKNLKSKTIVIYGTGLLFQYINENYDLSELNIIGVSDMKYAQEMEGQMDLGYKVIPKSSITKYNPDYIIIASENYMNLLESMTLEYSEISNVKLIPLAKKSWLEVVKLIWHIV